MPLGAVSRAERLAKKRFALVRFNSVSDLHLPNKKNFCYTVSATNEPMAFSNSRLWNQSKSLGWSHQGRLFEF